MAQQNNADPRAALLAGGLQQAGKLGAREVKETQGTLGAIIHFATSVLHRDAQDPRGPLVVKILKSRKLDRDGIREILVLLGDLTTGTDLEDVLADMLGTTGDQYPPCIVHREDGTIDNLDLNTKLGLLQAQHYRDEGYSFNVETDGKLHGRKPVAVQPQVVPAAAIAPVIDNLDEVVDVMSTNNRRKREQFVTQILVSRGLNDHKLRAVNPTGKHVEKFMEV